MWFAKYQGLGNDFVLVDRLKTDVVLTPTLVRRICDRRFGVGADGVLEILSSDTSLARMVVHNADGSIAEMCGNGLRCVARYLALREPTTPIQYSIETGAGDLPVHHVGTDVAVEMGAIVDHGQRSLELATGPLNGHFVSLGNPHYVLYGQWTRDDAIRLGPMIERHPSFPNGVNVSFATLNEGVVDLFVWERGCGLTQACGTGACATAAVGWLEERLDKADGIDINLPGGTLRIAGGPHALTMQGPAEHVFVGEWIAT